MRIIVTGSSGFIGHHLVQRLSEQGHEVLGLDRVTPLSTIANSAFRVVDILDREAVTRAFATFRPQGVMHLAARTDLDEQRSLDGYAVNTQGVENVISAIRRTGGIHRAIFTSSQLVCRIGYQPKADDDYLPSTLYGESKVRAEKLVRAADGGGVEWCIVRPTSVWGPRIGPHYQRFFRMVARGRYFHVGRKPLFKSYSYVGNTVHQYGRLIVGESGSIHHRTFYLADYVPVSLRDWADSFQRALGAPPIKSVPESIARAGAVIGDAINGLGWRAFPYNSFRLNNILTEYVFDMSSTKALCGPLPFSTDEGVAATAQWLQEEDIVPRRAAASSVAD